MPQSLSSLHVHLIFSTKNRRPLITDLIRGDLHSYLGTVIKDHGSHPNLINSVEDHIHLLFDMGRTVTISQMVEEIKTSSSKWMKRQGDEFSSFSWQRGYGAFAVSASRVPVVRRYITKQQEHHRKETFQEEFREFLRRYRIPYDERYVWD